MVVAFRPTKVSRQPFSPKSCHLLGQVQEVEEKLASLQELVKFNSDCVQAHFSFHELLVLVEDRSTELKKAGKYNEAIRQLIALAAVIGVSIATFGGEVRVESSSSPHLVGDRIEVVQGTSTQDSQAVQSKQVAPSAVRKQVATQDEKITALMRAIIGQESAGKFKAVNPHSGALGYGQVMAANVPSWTTEALGYELSTSEFLNSPKLQIKVIKFQLSKAWNSQLAVAKTEEQLVRRVASIWYSGRSKLWNNTKPQFYNGHPYPSINDYTKSVFQKYQRELSGEKSELKIDSATPAKDEQIAGYTVTSPWGKRNTGIPGATKFHKGTDLNLPEGTKVYPIGEAKNFRCWWDNSGGGNVASFDVPSVGKSFDYLHLKECNAATKEMRSGSTGIGAAHLHITQRDASGKKEPAWRKFIKQAIRGK